MKEKVIKTIQNYQLIQSGDKIVLGVSGGPDSLAMLMILNEIQQEKTNGLDFEFVVAHVNHNLRKEAKQEEEFVCSLCQKLNIDFYVKSIDVCQIAYNDKIGTEEAGRKVRYAFFEEVLSKIQGNKIAVAHHKNDKIETILMHVIRGCGIAGLKGIQPITNQVIRPLIDLERKEIEHYCEQNKLHPCIDQTNFDNQYTRNRIRNIVIPYLEKQFNPNFIETMNRLSELIEEEDQYIQQQVAKTYTEIVIEENSQQFVLDLKKFNQQEKVIQARILLYTIEKFLGTTKGIEKIHIEDIIQLCGNNIGNKYLTPNKNIKIFVKKGKIYFFHLI